MMYQRGDVVVCVLSGDYGKPRPAVVVQSDLFNPKISKLSEKQIEALNTAIKQWLDL